MSVLTLSEVVRRPERLARALPILLSAATFAGVMLAVAALMVAAMLGQVPR